MGYRDLVLHAYTLRKVSMKSGRLIIYCFDVWESQYKEWQKVFENIGSCIIFMAYKQSVEYFKEKFDNVYFLPQSMDENYFHPLDCKKERLFEYSGSY